MSDGKNRAKKMSYREGQGISYDQGADPPFLAQMKQQLGYKEYSIDDKFKEEDEHDEEDDDETIDRDDIRNMPKEERPQIVVLNPDRDISSEELEKEIEKKRKEEDERKILEGRITFRKPEKRPIEAEALTGNGTGEGRRNKGEEGTKRQRREEEEGRAKGQANNKRLLSFANDEEE